MISVFELSFVFFSLLSCLVTIALIVMLVLHIHLPEFSRFDCDTIPPFAYSQRCDHSRSSSSNCCIGKLIPFLSLIYDLFGRNLAGHPNGGYYWASTFAWILALLQTLATVIETRCF